MVVFIATSSFVDVPADHSLAQDEIFDQFKLLCLSTTKTTRSRLQMGLVLVVASVWTQDGSKQMRMAKRLKSGQVFINNYGAGGGVELPFGGRLIWPWT